MKLIKKLIASIFIPKNTPYCHHRFKYIKKIGTYGAKPCRYWRDDGVWEYCALLKQELSIQDQVKDCGINEKRWFKK